MTVDGIKDLLTRGEGIEAEFKEALFELPKSTFETICAFLNRKGGHLLLGVANNGAVEGVLDESTTKLMNDLVTAANNPQKLSPPVYLAPEVILYEGKSIVYCFVPESSQVHRTAGRIFDRNATDGDIDITDSTHQVAQLYLRKQQTYTENRIYPFASLSDFRPDLLKRVRTMAGNQRPGHPWTALSDEELLLSAGLRLKDVTTGQEGYTLAGLLLLGRDEVILSALPHHKTDALLRVRDTDRYDDRDTIRTNLLESYDRLMAFTAKHLPDPFFLLGTQRISLRDTIFREVVANLLVHREFANAYPAKFIIEREGVHTENRNRPHGHGLLLPGKALPFPKNPVMARFFREIGLMEELGSGLRNTFRFVPEYSGGKEPVFEEEDVFRCFIPVPETFFDQQKNGDTEKEGSDSVIDTVNGPVSGPVNGPVSQALNTIITNGLAEGVIEGITDGVKQELLKLVQLIATEPALSTVDISKQTGKPKSTVKRNLKLLRLLKIAEFRGAPRSGGYFLTKEFEEKIAG